MSDLSAKSYDLSELLKQIPFLGDIDPAGRRVFLRADFNVPLDGNGAMVDDGRLRSVLPTINYLLDQGARVIVGSHMRNPLENKQQPDRRYSFAPLARRLSRIWEAEVSFCPEVAGPRTLEAAENLPPGRVLLLENLRFHPGEIAADQAFAEQLSQLTDIYVNDAFGVCHRPHASMVTLPRLAKTSVGGFALKSELKAMYRALSHPARPLGVIIGGRDIKAKLPLLAKVMGLADFVFLGGTIGDAISRLAFGGDITRLSLDDDIIREIERLLNRNSQLRAKLFMPIDALISGPQDDCVPQAQIVAAQNLRSHMISEDIGPATCLWYKEVLASCRTIIWSGPLGAFEKPAFTKGTALVTKALASCQGVTLAGGVDTSTAILKMSDRNQVSFLSTGGSSFLKALAGQPLVALEALISSQHLDA